jgi:hypothetical protein
MGLEPFITLLKRGQFGFQRQRGFFAYDGKHKNIEWYELKFPKLSNDLNREWLRIIEITDTNSSIEFAINWMLRHKPQSMRNLIIDNMIKHTKEIEISNVIKSWRSVNENDFMNANIRELLNISSSTISDACDINDNQIKIGIDEGVSTISNARDVDKALAIAFANYNLKMSEHLKKIGGTNCDLYLDSNTNQILRAKLNSLVPGMLKSEAIDKLLHTKKIPDFTSLILESKLSIENIVELTYSNNTTEMKNWIHNQQASDSDDILNAYIAELSEKYLKGYDIRKEIVKYLVTAAIATQIPELGIALGAADIIMKLVFRKWHPILFIDELQNTIG